jgi:hypothetical protein
MIFHTKTTINSLIYTMEALKITRQLSKPRGDPGIHQTHVCSGWRCINGTQLLDYIIALLMAARCRANCVIFSPRASNVLIWRFLISVGDTCHFYSIVRCFRLWPRVGNFSLQQRVSATVNLKWPLELGTLRRSRSWAKYYPLFDQAAQELAGNPWFSIKIKIETLYGMRYHSFWTTIPRGE